MKKKSLPLLFCLLILSCIALPVRAASTAVQDFAGLLDTTEEEVLSDWCWEVGSQHGLDVVLLAIPDLMGKSARDFADNFYENNRYKEDGILFLVDIDSRQWHISTSGTATELLSDRDLEKIEGAVIPYFSDGRYYDGFCRFLDILPDCLKADTDTGISIPLSLLAGGLIAGVAVLLMRGNMNTKRAQFSAHGYCVENSYHLKKHQDLFLYSNITKQPRPKNSASGSSVHRTSGRSHGGRGGRF